MNILLFNIYLTSWTPRLCILMYCISLAGREKKVNQPLLWVKTCYEVWVVTLKRKVAAFPSRHFLRMETICKYWKRLAIFTSSLSPVRGRAQTQCFSMQMVRHWTINRTCQKIVGDVAFQRRAGAAPQTLCCYIGLIYLSMQIQQKQGKHNQSAVWWLKP